MRRPSRVRSLIQQTLVVLLGGIQPTLACDTCNRLIGNSLSLSHPRAIEIAVATRQAIEKGQLRDQPKVAPELLLLPQGGRGGVALDRVPAPQLVEGWAARLNQTGKHHGMLGVHILFVDTEQKCGLMLREGTAIYESKPSFHADARIVTTRAGFHALMAGQLNEKQAQTLGLVVIEGDSKVAMLLASMTDQLAKPATSVGPLPIVNQSQNGEKYGTGVEFFDQTWKPDNVIKIE